jgi:hypothetical protein
MSNRRRETYRVASGSGLGIDHAGGPVVDPTANVLQLVAAANERQDDLRDLNNRLLDAQITRLEGEVAHEHNLNALRAIHAKEIAELETKRTDSIRSVDQLNASTAAERVLAAVRTLETTTANNAQTLRDLVSSTALTLAGQQDRKFADITERVMAVERSLSRGEGKEVLGAPAMEKLAAQIELLMRGGGLSEGKSAGMHAMWGYVLGALGLVSMLFGMYVSLK